MNDNPELSDEEYALTAREAVQAGNCLQVLRLMQGEGFSQKDACEQIGITPNTFRKWIAQNPEAAGAFRDLAEYVNKSELTMILGAKEEVLDKLLTQAKESDDVGELIKAAQYLDKRSEDLIHAESSISAAEEEAADYLTGPKQRKGKSRTRISVSQEKSGKVNISIDSDEDEIIDGTVVDNSSPVQQQDQPHF